MQILVGGIILLGFTYGVFFFSCSIDVGADLEESDQFRDIGIDGGNDNTFFFVAPIFKLIFVLLGTSRHRTVNDHLIIISVGP